MFFVKEQLLFNCFFFFFHKYSVVKTEITARLKHCIFWSSFFRGVFLIRLTGFKTPTLKHVSRLIIKTQNRLIQLLMTQFFWYTLSDDHILYTCQ